MALDVVQLTRDLIAIPSVSKRNNVEIADFLAQTLRSAGFDLERLAYTEPDGERKVTLVARKGQGTDGFCLYSHSDTVPGDEQYWDPFDPVMKDGRVFGRGSCDMKGPVAASIVAGAAVDGSKLRKPLFIVVTADEEIGYGGARQVVAESQLYRENGPRQGVICEPTQMIPVYAHKGGARIVVTAHGRAAHTSTDKGISANFLIAPFLAEMAALAPLFRSDERFMNREFDPPTNGFNMVLDDGGCAANVSAARTVCTLGLRTMPNDHHEDAIQMIVERAKHHNLEVEYASSGPFYTQPESEIVQAALAATGLPRAETVPFGTEATVFTDTAQLVVMGPGNIAQAHTVGEWVAIDQLQRAVAVYGRMIEQFCMA